MSKKKNKKKNKKSKFNSVFNMLLKEEEKAEKEELMNKEKRVKENKENQNQVKASDDTSVTTSKAVAAGKVDSNFDDTKKTEVEKETKKDAEESYDLSKTKGVQDVKEFFRNILGPNH